MDTLLALILILAVVVAWRSLYIVKANERALREFLGKPGNTVESGLHFALWPLSWLVRYSTEVVEIPLSRVGILTKAEGNLRQIKMNIDAVLYLYWPEDLVRTRKSLPSPANMDTLQSVLDEQTLEIVRQVLSEKVWTTIWSKRKECGDDITKFLSVANNPDYILNQAGIKKFRVVIKHIDPPEGLEKAISDPEIARLEKEATIARAEGAKEKLRLEGKGSADARAMLFDAIGKDPDRVQLELLYTLREMAQGTSNTILFPIPAEITSALSKMFGSRPGLDISQLINGLSDEQKQDLVKMLTQINKGGSKS